MEDSFYNCGTARDSSKSFAKFHLRRWQQVTSKHSAMVESSQRGSESTYLCTQKSFRGLPNSLQEQKWSETPFKKDSVTLLVNLR